MLSLNKVKKGHFIEIDGLPYFVLNAEHSKMGRAGAILRTKLKNLLSGNIIAKTFQGQEKIEEIDLERKKANFLYSDQAKLNFMDNETFEEIGIDRIKTNNAEMFLKEGEQITILFYKNNPLSIELPKIAILKVAEAPPSVRGNTAAAAKKEVILETGIKVNVPLFVNKNDLIKIDTETGEYKERA